jgi:hypothetical protein
MTEKEIYKLWLVKVPGLRYLRLDRWEEIKKVIFDQNVSSVLEFGSGVSTLLFDNLGLKVLSYETDPKYLRSVEPLCSPGVTFKLWNNCLAVITDYYDLALIDGILPRTTQFEESLKHANIIVIDDFDEELKNLFLPKLASYKRIDSQSTVLAIFKAI